VSDRDIPPALAALVRERAGDFCEYCLLLQQFLRERFQIGHIIARQHGGQTVDQNLALICLRCNRYKGPNIASLDPVGSALVPLFNPRIDKWATHFEWRHSSVMGLAPVGRATIVVLAMNSPDRLVVREALIEEGVFPPTRKQ
jgi:hypothetical protein